MNTEFTYNGRKGTFTHADIKELTDFDPALLEAVEGNMKQLSFIPIGDMSLNTFKNATIRQYASPNIKAAGIHVQGDKIEPYTEFFTTFSDGSSLTTTAGNPGDSNPKALIFRIVKPNMSIEELFNTHKTAISNHEYKRGVTALQPEMTLKWLAEAIDDFLVRLSGKER